MPFHLNLRRLRKAKGMSQEALALECGWKGQSRISNYEADPASKGARKPALDEIPVIAAALGVEIQELFDMPAKPSQSARPDPEILARAVTVLRNLASLQAGAATFLYDAPSILAIYDEVSRTPPDVDFDREAILGRMAAVLRGVGDEGMGRGGAVGSRGEAVGSD
jgi:transcriptional regulator with XRE-family HTH domain